MRSGAAFPRALFILPPLSLLHADSEITDVSMTYGGRITFAKLYAVHVLKKKLRMQFEKCIVRGHRAKSTKGKEIQTLVVCMNCKTLNLTIQQIEL
jgi:hypothetical protein